MSLGGPWKCEGCGIYLRARQYLIVHRACHCRAGTTAIRQQDTDSEDEGRPRRSGTSSFYRFLFCVKLFLRSWDTAEVQNMKIVREIYQFLNESSDPLRQQ